MENNHKNRDKLSDDPSMKLAKAIDTIPAPVWTIMFTAENLPRIEFGTISAAHGYHAVSDTALQMANINMSPPT